MTDQPIEVDKDETREFASFLLFDHNKGRTHAELTEKLAQLVVAVEDTGKSGKLTLTIKVEPAKNVDEMVVVSDEIKLAAPELDRPATMFFATKTGELRRDHPAQESMFSIQGEATS